MKNHQYKLIVVLLATLFLGSCVSNKKVVYFQEKNDQVAYVDSFKFDRKLYQLQPNDIINIDVAAKSEKFAKIFLTGNIATQNMGNQAANFGGDIFYTSGYNINDSGFINFPLVGNVKVAGLNMFEIEEKIEKKLELYEEGVHVAARLGGIRFSLIGEFIRPGKYVLMQNQVNIFEAIATGGDLKEIARRDRVVLLRQYPDGAKLHYLDLLDKNIINSPYFFIQPNDVLYVEPLKRRAYGVGVNGLQTLTTVLSIISTTLVVITFLNQ